MVQVTAGLPFAMLAAAWGFFLSRPAGDAFWWTPASFLVGAVFAVLVALGETEEDRLVRVYLRILGLACLGLPGFAWRSAAWTGPRRCSSASTTC